MAGIDLYVPEHKIEEIDEDIIITVFAPLSKPKEAALILEKKVFTFDSPPYFMRIKFPHPVTGTDITPAYDNATHTYKIKFKKSNSKLTESSDEEENDEISDLLHYASVSNEKTNTESKESKQYYGFANSYSNMFGKLYEEFSDIINLPEPDKTDSNDRTKLKLNEEVEKWDDDHYLADTMETDHLESIFKYEPLQGTPLLTELSTCEKETLEELLKNYKKKELSEDIQKLSELQLVDILFAYAYNKRTTEGDNTVESGWTINKLSSTLSWFEVFENLKSVLLSCYKRSLIYPLYRNWNLAQLVHRDVIDILKSGSKQVLRCLLEVIDVFNESDNRYLLNTLYVNDLCCFVYYMPDERFLTLSEEVEKINITKYEVNSDLPLLEIAAHITLEEEKTGTKAELSMETIAERIASLNLDHQSSTDESSESDSEESDSTQSSDSES